MASVDEAGPVCQPDDPAPPLPSIAQGCRLGGDVSAWTLQAGDRAAVATLETPGGSVTGTASGSSVWYLPSGAVRLIVGGEVIARAEPVDCPDPANGEMRLESACAAVEGATERWWRVGNGTSVGMSVQLSGAVTVQGVAAPGGSWWFLAPAPDGTATLALRAGTETVTHTTAGSVCGQPPPTTVPPRQRCPNHDGTSDHHDGAADHHHASPRQPPPRHPRRPPEPPTTTTTTPPTTTTTRPPTTTTRPPTTTTRPHDDHHDLPPHTTRPPHDDDPSPDHNQFRADHHEPGRDHHDCSSGDDFDRGGRRPSDGATSTTPPSTTTTRPDRTTTSERQTTTTSVPPTTTLTAPPTTEPGPAGGGFGAVALGLLGATAVGALIAGGVTLYRRRRSELPPRVGSRRLLNAWAGTGRCLPGPGHGRCR